MLALGALRNALVIPRRGAADAYLGSECFQMGGSGEGGDLAEGISAVYAAGELRARLARNATTRNEPYRWVHQAKRYVEIVERLARRARSETSREVLSEVPENV